MYGDEIGMADASELVAPAVERGPFGYRTVNVADQEVEGYGYRWLRLAGMRARGEARMSGDARGWRPRARSGRRSRW